MRLLLTLLTALPLGCFGRGLPDALESADRIVVAQVQALIAVRGGPAPHCWRELRFRAPGTAAGPLLALGRARVTTLSCDEETGVDLSLFTPGASVALFLGRTGDREQVIFAARPDAGPWTAFALKAAPAVGAANVAAVIRLLESLAGALYCVVRAAG